MENRQNFKCTYFQSFPPIGSRGRTTLTISPVNFNSISPPQPCILAGVNVQPRGILKQLSDKPDLVWADFENIPDYPLINITKGPEYSVTREFINSMQGDMDFANCLTSFSFLDQIVTSCIGFISTGPLVFVCAY